MDKENWDIVLKGAQVIATVVVACLVYLFTRRNMRFETQERLSRFRNDKAYEAGMAFWSLLSYTTPTENRHSIIYWVKVDKEKKYYVHVSNAREYIKELNVVNYERGLGLFISQALRGKYYEYRSILYGFLLAVKNEKDDKILVSNTDMIKKLLHLHDEMVVMLREELKL